MFEIMFTLEKKKKGVYFIINAVQEAKGTLEKAMIQRQETQF